MTSPTSTSGAGFKFEDRVIASYLTAMLAEAPARGLLGSHVATVLTQRAALGYPLDDVIVCGLMADGSASRLSLQATADLTFTEADPKWVKTVHQAWSTFSAQSFQPGKDTLGVAISTYSARADKHYRTLLTWAAYSPSPSDFFQRLAQKGVSHQSQRDFVATLRTLLEKAAGRAIADDELWNFLQAFRIIHFDFSAQGTSRDAESAQDRLRQCLPTEGRQHTSALWGHLIAEAGTISTVAGGTTRVRLISQLRSAGYLLAGAPSLTRDLLALTQESERILAGIKADLHGLHLSRGDVTKLLEEALQVGRFVQIDGEPGSGKSGILKQAAREAAQTGPIFVLKDLSIHPRGWSAHSTQIGVTRDLPSLLAELGATGQPVLFIDGIDRIIDPAVHLTVNDILRAIAHDQRLSAWKVVVTVREQNLDHIKSWLDGDALAKLPIKSVTVPILSDDDLGTVATKFQRLRPLLIDGQHLDHLLRRPFFLDAMLRLTGHDTSQELPASEIELMNLWWKLGGAEGANAATQQHRRNLLLALADRLLVSPGRSIAIRDLSPETLEDLRMAGVIRDQLLGHSVTFTHDIYEEWSLCQWLLPNLSQVAQSLAQTHEPNALIRPVQLAASYALEAHPTDREWRLLYENISAASVRSVWQRMVLLGCIRTTRSTEVLGRLSGYLKEHDNDGLRKIISALATLEVTPDARYLDETLSPGLTHEQRVACAHQAAQPKAMIWLRFLDWFLAEASGAVPFLPELVSLFSTWQDAYSGLKVRHCARIGQLAAAWLSEFEATVGAARSTRPQAPFGLRLEPDVRQQLESELRALLLKSAPDVPGLVTSYLEKHATNRGARVIQNEILQYSPMLARALPAVLVAFVKTVFFETAARQQNAFADEDVHERGMGIARSMAFYPASPLQPPFLALLVHAEPQGLQLIKDTCNHCLAAWRAWHLRGSRIQQPLTPEPFSISFPWGTQEFWGDETVYEWFRGAGRIHACTSALMALEQWALKQAEGGGDLETIVRKIIDGNESAGALGVAVSVCLANVSKAVPASLPLITSAHVWHWDISRSGREPSLKSTNASGHFDRYRVLLTAVRKLNSAPHRDRSIRDLVNWFMICEDSSIRDQYQTGIEQFATDLPISFTEELGHEHHLAELRKLMNWFLEQAHPKHWTAHQRPDGAIVIANEAPSLNDPERLQTLAGLEQMNERLRLMMWAQECLTTTSPPEAPSLADALTAAKSIDHTTLFEEPNDDLHDSQRRDVVAGVAFVAARFTPDSLWDSELATWCTRTLERAARYQDADPYMVRDSVLSTHPTIFAAAGFSALLQRGHEPGQARQVLIDLLGHPIHAVGGSVVTSARWYVERDPDFYALLFTLSVHLCVVPSTALDGRMTLALSPGELDVQQSCRTAADKALATGVLPAPPRVPLPWIPMAASPASAEERGEFQQNPLLFRWDVAPHTVLRFDVRPLLSHRSLRNQFLILVDDLREMTFQEMAPPFADSFSDSVNVPHAWVYAFFYWLGITSTHLSLAEVERHVLAPIRSKAQELDLLAMNNFMPAFLANGLMPPAQISQERLRLWRQIATWVLDHPGARADLDHLGDNFFGCLSSLLFCMTSGIGRPVCFADPGWEEVSQFSPIIERVIHDFGAHRQFCAIVLIFLTHVGHAFSPRPALDWLARIAESNKHNRQFWHYRGDAMTAVLKDIYEKRSSALSTADRLTIASIIDVLVDNAVRSAGMLQQQLLRESDA